MDFSDNYSFVLQNEVESFHWNNSQATIYITAMYYRQTGEIKFKSFVISECLTQNMVATYIYIIFLMVQEHSTKIGKIS